MKKTAKRTGRIYIGGKTMISRVMGAETITTAPIKCTKNIMPSVTK